MSIDPMTGHSLGKPSFVTHDEHQPTERPTREPLTLHPPIRPTDAELVERFQAFAPSGAVRREPTGLLDRTIPDPRPARSSAVQQPGPNPEDELRTRLREVEAQNARLLEQIAELRKTPQAPPTREQLQRATRRVRR